MPTFEVNTQFGPRTITSDEPLSFEDVQSVVQQIESKTHGPLQPLDNAMQGPPITAEEIAAPLLGAPRAPRMPAAQEFPSPLKAVADILSTKPLTPFPRVEDEALQQGAKEGIFTPFERDPAVQQAAGAIGGGMAGSLIGQPFLGTLSGTLLTKLTQGILADKFSAGRFGAEAISETVTQAAVATFTRGLLTGGRAALRILPGPVAFLYNELGKRAQGIGERIMKPLSRRAGRALQQEKTFVLKQAGYADVKPLVDFAKKLDLDERQTFIRWYRSTFPVSGKAYDVLVSSGKNLNRLKPRVRAITADALEGIRQRVGREIRRLEGNPGQELATRLPADFQRTLVRYRGLIDDIIDDTITNAGLDKGVVKAARDAHFKRVAADAIDVQAHRFWNFNQFDLTQTFQLGAFRNVMRQETGSRATGVIRRAMKSLETDAAYQKEIRKFGKLVGGIQFNKSGTAPFALRLPIAFQTTRRLSNILASPEELGVFNRTLQKALQRFVIGEKRVIPINLIQTAIASTDTGMQDAGLDFGFSVVDSGKEKAEQIRRILRSVEEDALTR